MFTFDENVDTSGFHFQVEEIMDPVHGNLLILQSLLDFSFPFQLHVVFLQRKRPGLVLRQPISGQCIPTSSDERLFVPLLIMNQP